MLDFVFHRHLRLALDAALLFAVGAFAAWAVVRYRLTAFVRLPFAIYDFVLRLMGPAPSLLRLGAVIFGFNTIAMFLYMATGFHPMVPKIIGIWTGMNVTMLGLLAGRGEGALPQPNPFVVPGQWVPPWGAAFAAGLVVLAVEIPCFCFSIAMGVVLLPALLLFYLSLVSLVSSTTTPWRPCW